jgi:hypothetical protein
MAKFAGASSVSSYGELNMKITGALGSGAHRALGGGVLMARSGPEREGGRRMAAAWFAVVLRLRLAALERGRELGEWQSGIGVLRGS